MSPTQIKRVAKGLASKGEGFEALLPDRRFPLENCHVFTEKTATFTGTAKSHKKIAVFSVKFVFFYVKFAVFSVKIAVFSVKIAVLSVKIAVFSVKNRRPCENGRFRRESGGRARDPRNFKQKLNTPPFEANSFASLRHMKLLLVIG